MGLVKVDKVLGIARENDDPSSLIGSGGVLENVGKFFQGTFQESFDCTAASDGAVITASLEQSGGGDLTMQFSDGLSTLDCTPATTIELTAGTDSSPQPNYIYILQSTKALTKSTSDWPSAEHIKVCYFLVPSAATVQTDDCYITQNWNDHLVGTDGMGHLSHIAERSRRDGAYYFSGIGPAGVDDYLTIAASNVEFASNSGVIFQMHKHTFPAQDTATGDDVRVVNWSGDSFHRITDLFEITADSTGTTIGTNKWFNLVVWGVANKTGTGDSIFINLPGGFYNVEADATNDVASFDDYSIPREFGIDSSTGFLICRITVQMKTTWGYGSTVDLRGVSPQVASGVGGAVKGSGTLNYVPLWTGGSTLADSALSYDAAQTYTLTGNSLVVGNSLIAGNDQDTTSGAVTALTLNRETSGLIGIGIGANIDWTIESQDAAAIHARIAGTLRDISSGAEDARMDFLLSRNGSLDTVMRLDGDNRAVMGNFGGVMENVASEEIILTAGSGLTGGGTLAADRTFNIGAGDGITVNADDVEVDINGLTADASPVGSTDYVMSYDADAGALKKVLMDDLPGGGAGGHTIQEDGVDLASQTNLNFQSGLLAADDAGNSATTVNIVEGEIDHDSLLNFASDEHVAHSGVTLTAGTGLTGGGTIAASRTFNVGAGTGITVNADDVAVDTTANFSWTGNHDWADSDTVTFGTGSDLVIQHDGTDNRFESTTPNQADQAGFYMLHDLGGTPVSGNPNQGVNGSVVHTKFAMKNALTEYVFGWLAVNQSQEFGSGTGTSLTLVRDNNGDYDWGTQSSIGFITETHDRFSGMVIGSVSTMSLYLENVAVAKLNDAGITVLSDFDFNSTSDAGRMSMWKGSAANTGLLQFRKRNAYSSPATQALVNFDDQVTSNVYTVEFMIHTEGGGGGIGLPSDKPITFDDTGASSAGGLTSMTRGDTQIVYDSASSELQVEVDGTEVFAATSSNIGFYNTAPVAQQDITGSTAGNAALQNLLTALAALGLITDSTT